MRFELRKLISMKICYTLSRIKDHFFNLGQRGTTSRASKRYRLLDEEVSGLPRDEVTNQNFFGTLFVRLGKT